MQRQITLEIEERLGRRIFAHLASQALEQWHGIVALVVPECRAICGSHLRLNVREYAMQRRAECACQVGSHRW